MEVNWIAVIAAAVSAFVLGGLWYGPLFGKKWMALVGLSEEQARSGSPAGMSLSSTLGSMLASSTCCWRASRSAASFSVT